MGKRKEEPPEPKLSKAEEFAKRCADRMAARIAESSRIAMEYEQTLDPRQRTHAGP